MASLERTHALVTGGGTGIGAAIAAALHAEGARVSIAGRRRATLDETASRLPGTHVVQADVTREDDCAAMIASARAVNGAIDIIVANAGAARSAPLARTDLALWQHMLDANLTGTFLSVSAALADLRREPRTPGDVRRIVLIASTAGLKGYPYVAAYCAAKHGVVGLARALAAELGPIGITANAICPGFTETPLLEASVANIVAKTGRSADAARRELAAGNPQGRFVRPDEVAAAVAWLCLPSSGSVNGQAISISGGEI
jgi:NAD(P)-dependent dehydrogenase (short-subunit alcohol dehydrogenase family)